jgi:hypothetical protein
VRVSSALSLVEPIDAVKSPQEFSDHQEQPSPHASDLGIDTICVSAIPLATQVLFYISDGLVCREWISADETVWENVTAITGDADGKLTPDTRSVGMSFLIELQNLSQPSPSESPKPGHFRG